jgi:hypothetical protein
MEAMIVLSSYSKRKLELSIALYSIKRLEVEPKQNKLSTKANHYFLLMIIISLKLKNNNTKETEINIQIIGSLVTNS